MRNDRSKGHLAFACKVLAPAPRVARLTYLFRRFRCDRCIAGRISAYNILGPRSAEGRGKRWQGDGMPERPEVASCTEVGPVRPSRGEDRTAPALVAARSPNNQESPP